MDVEDELCDELYRWMNKQEECADHLKDLAKELEEMREVMTAGQLVGNTATVLGSAALIGTGIATFMTGGLAAPLLVMAASLTVGAGTVTSLACTLLENWKSSEKMKNAQKTAEQIEKICKDIERLQEKLSEECKSQDLSSNEVQCKITARILRAMAKRSGRDLPLSRLIRLLTTIDTLAVQAKCSLLHHCRYFARSPWSFLGKNCSKKRSKICFKCYENCIKGNRPVFTFLQVAGGALVLAFTLPELIDNCEKLVKNKHETEASRYLRTKAGEMRDAVKKVKNLLTELQEMLSEIPETECHVDLATEMCGSQTYTRGTICMEYKQTKKQDRKIESLFSYPQKTSVPRLVPSVNICQMTNQIRTKNRSH
ncbi:hypothetical protein QTP86_015586 [Hemibagrus guttatus]|nr:hypothetical protein QTP86_015586 [Hemibagrus guttatus]